MKPTEALLPQPPVPHQPDQGEAEEWRLADSDHAQPQAADQRGTGECVREICISETEEDSFSSLLVGVTKYVIREGWL